MKSAFAPHQFLRDQFQPIRDWVICTEMNFEGRTLSSGVILLNDNGRADGIRPRWARVWAIGPEQKEVEVGQWICVEHGRWGRTVELETDDGTGDKLLQLSEEFLLEHDWRPDDIIEWDIKDGAITMRNKTWEKRNEDLSK